MKLLKWALGIGVCAWLGQFVLALMLPNLIMQLLYSKGIDGNRHNQLYVQPIPDETARSVVRPSPDLLYAICFYDLSEGDVVINAQVPEAYWSMQFYQMNTDNFAGITNQRDEQHRAGKRAKITLINQEDSSIKYSGKVVRSPTDRGVVLLRVSAIGDSSKQVAALQASSCSSVSM